MGVWWGMSQGPMPTQEPKQQAGMVHGCCSFTSSHQPTGELPGGREKQATAANGIIPESYWLVVNREKWETYRAGQRFSQWGTSYCQPRTHTMLADAPPPPILLSSTLLFLFLFLFKLWEWKEKKERSTGPGASFQCII